jgi:hypothetical protein
MQIPNNKMPLIKYKEPSTCHWKQTFLINEMLLEQEIKKKMDRVDIETSKYSKQSN